MKDTETQAFALRGVRANDDGYIRIVMPEGGPFDVYRRNTIADEWIRVAQYLRWGTEFMDHHVSAGDSYEYRIVQLVLPLNTMHITTVAAPR